MKLKDALGLAAEQQGINRFMYREPLSDEERYQRKIESNREYRKRNRELLNQRQRERQRKSKGASA